MDETAADTNTVMIDIQLSLQELALIREAIDSHVYWQLSDDHYRSEGYVREPGSDDLDNTERITAAWALLRRLESRLQGTEAG